MFIEYEPKKLNGRIFQNNEIKFCRKMKSLSNFLIVLTIWIGMLVIIGLSIHKHWGSPYGVWIPLAFLALSFREITKLGNKKDSAPRTPYDITQEDIDKDIHEGRE